MVPCSSGSADAKADKGSGTCSSVSLVLRCAAPQTARPATSIATLRCETVSVAATASTATDSRPPSRTDKREKGMGDSASCRWGGNRHRLPGSSSNPRSQLLPLHQSLHPHTFGESNSKGMAGKLAFISSDSMRSPDILRGG